MTAQHDRVATFHRLHASGCFVIPNPWDAGSARALEQLGFAALATTSAAHLRRDQPRAEPQNRLKPAKPCADALRNVS